MSRTDLDRPAPPPGAAERPRHDALPAALGDERGAPTGPGEASARPKPPSGRFVAALLLLASACGPLLGIDDVEEAPVGGAGQGGGGASQGPAGAGGTPGAGGGASGAGGGAGGGGGGGGSGGGGQGGGPTGPVGYLRFANLVPPAFGPAPGAFDLCLRQPGMTAWTGPILRALNAPPLQFEQVSNHGPLPAGNYELVAVRAPLGECESAEAIGLASGVLELSEGSFHTVAVAGDPLSPDLVPFLDGLPRGPDAEEVEISFVGAARNVDIVALFGSPSDGVFFGYTGSGQKVVKPGPWPVTELFANNKPVVALSPPLPSPPRGYTAFFVPAPGEPPLAMLVCSNLPPAVPMPGGNCVHVALGLPEQPPP
ncbi:MAG TPA: hypothetical protein VFS43_19190 [Polyangiaceae bacterium]|nr:hypothetical protein [Polyangiaceae bacterium]